jgi:hypothetical protein
MMVAQNDPRLCPELHKYGCYFLSLAYYREKYQGVAWTADDLNKAWYKAKALGYVTGDLNHDGDTDDQGELEILNPDSLCILLGIGLKIKKHIGDNWRLTTHFPLGSPEADGCFVITAWYNPATKFTHFVVGSTKPVEFDPIAGGSRTVRDGFPQSIRIFERS